jgi:hypothetical protein
VLENNHLTKTELRFILDLAVRKCGADSLKEWFTYLKPCGCCGSFPTGRSHKTEISIVKSNLFLLED